MFETPDWPASISEAMKIANSSEAQQLITLLKQNNSNELQDVLNLASTGDWEKAKDRLISLLQDSEAKSIMQQMHGE